MSAVDDCSFVPLLKARWPVDLGQATLNRRIVDVHLSCADRGDGERGILSLISAAKCNRVLLMWFGYELDRTSTFRRALSQNNFNFFLLRRRNNGHFWFNDPGFLGRDLLERIAEPFLMIERDRCDDGNVRLNGVGGVEPAAQACFQNNNLNLSTGFRFTPHLTPLPSHRGERGG